MLLNKKSAPKNQTNDHWELTQIAKYIARHKGCIIIAEEVSGFADKSIHKSKKGIVDVGGIKLVTKKVTELPEIATYGFESKVSLTDFKAGFNCGAEFSYIVAPKGVIDKELIPDGIGFYEVDLKNYRIGTKRVYYGIELVKKPKRRHGRKRYRTKFLMLKEVARRATNQDLFKNPQIMLADNERKI